MTEYQEKEDSADRQRKIVEEAKERFRLAEEAEADIRAKALDDLEFRAGEQWPSEVMASRNKDGRPCLTINRIPQFIQQITNDQRQNRPSIKVHPVDDNADVETAKTLQGLVRHIEYNSNADAAYDTAFEGAVTHGFGFIRVITDFVSPWSFDQEILIKRVKNPFSVYLDPSAQEPDASDAKWGFVIDEMSREELKRKYPESKLASSDWDTIGITLDDWVEKESVRIAEYFYKDVKEVDLVLLSNGEILERDKLAEYLNTQAMDGSVISIVKERKAQIPVIKWCKITGADILEETEWPGIYIPIVPVYGTELIVNGERKLEGIVRNAKDSQRMYNYWASAETEAIALAPKSPWIVAEGQIEGYEEEWATANVRNHSVLNYKPMSLNSTPVPPPQRNVYEPAVQAITQARMIASDDLKATTGIYDAAMGAKSNETSGVAIQRRNVQAQTSNYHFVDNLTRSLRHLGRILVDLIPHIYDTARTARIIGEDGTQKVVKLNQPFQDQGEIKTYQLGAGKYDVTVDVGPSFASKRQEAIQGMLEVTRAYPQLAQIAGDLLVKNMDWPGAQEFSDRIKKTLPPGLAEDPQGQKPLPPQVQAQMQQMGQMVDALTKQLEDANDKLENKTLELESKERIELKKLEVQLEIERAKLDAKDSLALLNAEIAQINQRLELLKNSEPVEVEEPQEMSEPPIGAMGAGMGEEEQTPIGGPSPSTNMEGMT